MRHFIQMGIQNPFLDEAKQHAIKAILEEHLGAAVQMQIIPASEAFPEESGAIAHEMLAPHWLKCSFEADIPPIENSFLTNMMPQLIKILGNYFSYKLSFADPILEQEGIADGCFKMSKMRGGAFEEEERAAIAQILRKVKPNIIVKFHQSSDLLCEGMNIEEYDRLCCNKKPSSDAFSIQEQIEDLIRRNDPQEELSCEVVAKSELKKGKRK